MSEYSRVLPVESTGSSASSSDVVKTKKIQLSFESMILIDEKIPVK
jgi:hypothetical protein